MILSACTTVDMSSSLRDGWLSDGGPDGRRGQAHHAGDGPQAGVRDSPGEGEAIDAGPGSAATFDVVVESAGAYPLVTHSLTGALRGAIAVLLVGPDAKDAPLMPMVPWVLPAK